MKSYTSKFFNLLTNKSIEETSEILSDLLEYENVKYKKTANEIFSLSTPFPFFNFDRRAYSRRNWVGINPFVYISGIKIILKSRENFTALTIELDRMRSYAILVCFLIFIGISAVNFSNGGFGFLFFSTSSVLAYFAVLYFLSYKLIKDEIDKAMKA